MKSKRLLADFVTYCFANQEQRFWQALLNWSKYSYIFGSNKEGFDDHSELEDTYYLD